MPTVRNASAVTIAGKFCVAIGPRREAMSAMFSVPVSR